MKHSTLLITAWNANGISSHIPELTLYLSHNKIDVLLISETHATDRTFIKIPGYDIYLANHPDNHAHAGAAVIIRSALKHHDLQPYTTEKIQSACVSVSLSSRPITIAAIYSPPKHTITPEEYMDYLTQLGPYFIVAGDWNAKHTNWGSRLTSRKGRNLLQAMSQLHINYLSTGEPTYWPTDPDKLPDVLDFALLKGVSPTYVQITSTLDLTSDHTALLITLNESPILQESPPRLCTKTTDWQLFREVINNTINLSIRLKEPHEIDTAVHHWVTTFNRLHGKLPLRITHTGPWLLAPHYIYEF
jgi:hypothetical protein